MPTKYLTNLEEIKDFVRGATYYGTGGGGSAEGGVEVLQKCLEEGGKIGWVDVSEIPEGSFTACPFGMGSIAPKTEESIKQQHSFGCTDIKFDRGHNFVRAVEELEKETGKKIDVLIPIELGGGNSASCMAAASMTSRLVADGDYTGRAIPEIYQTTPYIHELPLLPLTSCDSWGNICVIREALNWRVAERLGKFLSVAAFTGCAMAGFAFEVADMKKALIAGSLTECYELGKAIRLARESGGDPVLAGAQQLDGWVVCRGTVTKKEWWDQEGYLWGWHTIAGEGEYEGREMRIFYKNENHLCYQNGEVLVTSPDIIVVVDDETGDPLTNTVIAEGQKVAVVAARARPTFRTPRGMEALGPQNFGEDAPYVPVEEKLK